MVLGEVFDAAIEHTDGSDFIEVPPKIAGPVDVSSPQWSDRHLTEGTSVELTSHRQYEPVEPGQSMLEVRTVDPEAGQFGFQQVPPPGEPVPIEVKQIQIGIEPDDVTVEPDEITFFTVTVTNSAHPEMVEIDNPDALQGDADIEHDGGSTHTISYQAPADPDPEQVDLLTVRHTAETGARRNSTDERLGRATIRFGEPTLRVSPRSACLEPGQTEPEPFTAEVTGSDADDPGIVWEASLGDIDENGLYTPPGEAGEAMIKASLQSDPTVSDSVTVQIGGCSCIVSVTVDGVPREGEGLPVFTLTEDLSGVEGGFSFIQPVGDVSGNVSWGFGEDPAGPTPIALGATGPFNVLIQGTQPGVGPYNSYFKQDGEETGLQTMAEITENDGNVLAGTLSGSVWLWYEDRPGLFSMRFRIEADPALSDERERRCLLEDEDG